MFRLILVYTQDSVDDYGLREHTNKVFDSMGALLVYLNGVHVDNIYRVIIERG
jgi:hypothetical protein